MSAEATTSGQDGPEGVPIADGPEGAEREASTPPRGTFRDRLGPLTPILIFDVAGPLAVYYGARSVGLSTVVALMLSGVLPAVRVIATVLRHRCLDAIGTLVLSGIVLGTVTGLVTGSARLYLIDGLVPTVVLGVVCLASLLSSRPMMFRIALETMGEQSSKGQAFVYMWRYHEFRRMFRIITAVWGLMFLTESFVQAAIIGTASINTAKSTSTFLPLVALALTFGWTRVYGIRAQSRNRVSDEEASTAEGSNGPG